MDIFKTIMDLDKCSNHTSSDVKFYCKDHEEHCCEKCAIVKHRKCDNLIAIEDLVEESDLDSTTERLSSQLDVALASCDELAKFYEDQEQKLERSELDLDTSFEQIEQNLIKLFDDFKDRFKKEFEMKRKNKMAEISTTLVKVENLRDNVTHQKKVLEMAKKFGSRLQQLFAALKVQDDTQKFKTTFVDVYDTLKSETIQVEAHLQIIANVKQSLEAIHIGIKSDDLVLPILSESLKQPTPFHERQVILEHEMVVTGTTTIDGCVVLPSNKVVISSRFTKSIIVLDIEKKTVLNTYNFPSEPWNLKQIGQNKTHIGVTFPDEKKVRTIEIGGSITCLKEIKVSDQCYGLAYCSATDTIFTLFRSSGDIARYEPDGTPLSNLPLSKETKSKVKGAVCMTFSHIQKVILTSCYDTGRVLAINMEGNVVFDCSCGRNPWEITLDPADNMYVCLCGGHAIQQLNKSGQMIRDILTCPDGIKEPKAIDWSNNFNSFVLVTNGSVMCYRFEK